MSDDPEIVIRFKSTGKHANPLAIRIRQVLKIALRRFGLRAVEVREAPLKETHGNDTHA